jgi:prophage antirepressor-like protein
VNLSTFNFEAYAVRVVSGADGEPWFVAADVCDALTIGNSRDAVGRLDHDEKADVGIADTSSNGVTQGRNVTVINESGLYSLILTSRKPEAKRFKRWVTHDVLPSIRKTGAYVAPGAATAAVDDPAVTRLAALRAAGLLSRAGAEVASFCLLGLQPPLELLRAMEPTVAAGLASRPIAPAQLELLPAADPSDAPAARPIRAGDELVSRQTLAYHLGVMPEFLTDVMIRHGLLCRSDRVLTPGTSRRRHMLTDAGAAIGFQPRLAAPLFWSRAAQAVLRPLL